jgi:hypothetical protein
VRQSEHLAFGMDELHVESMSPAGCVLQFDHRRLHPDLYCRMSGAEQLERHVKLLAESVSTCRRVLHAAGCVHGEHAGRVCGS